MHFAAEAGVNLALWGGVDLFFAAHYTYFASATYNLIDFDGDQEGYLEFESSDLLHFTLGVRLNF